METDPGVRPKRRATDKARTLVGGNLLDVLDEDDRARLFAAGRLRVVEAGEELARQGSIEDCLFVVARGELEVVRCLPGDEEKILFTAKPGTLLGEVAVLDGGARSATLRATRRSVVREIGLGAFEAVTLYGSAAGHRILRVVAASVHERLKMTRLAAHSELDAHPMPLSTDLCLDWSAPPSDVVGVLAVLPAFAGLDAADWKAMLPQIRIVLVERGTDLVLPEASSPGIVIVLRGALSPWLDDASGPEVTMPVVGPGGFVDYAAALGFEAEPQRWRARSRTQLLRLDPACLEPNAASAARLLYALSRVLATTLRRSTGLSMHFRTAWAHSPDALHPQPAPRSGKAARKAPDGLPV